VAGFGEGPLIVMSAEPSWWQGLCPLFTDPATSCPEVCLSGLLSAEVINLVQVVRAAGQGLIGEPLVYHQIQGREVRLVDLPDATELVVKGAAAPFHFLLRGLTTDGLALPDIGVFVLPNAVALDWETGPAWTYPRVRAFLRLVLRLTGELTMPTLSLEETTPPELIALFQESLCSLAEEV
jgi:hypothetical protein